ncbi:TnsA-like heteromeric transposase endonuclease subunit [Kitasatospora sp. NPDC098652]|uniref:TnsA-like heteromeric transposase endonuclease subunit n=1 Tax=Kitasatospora sp. NPDC098652 TaxID=3364095 RepID=UPI00381CADE9
MTTRRTRTLHPLTGHPGPARVRYYDASATERLVPAADAASVRFEDCLPARDLPSYPGIRHTPGSYWVTCCDAVLDYESYLESKWMRLLDFDDQVKALAAQPFVLEGTDMHGKWTHVPDLFVRRSDDTALLVDVKNPQHLDKPRVRLQAQRTAAVCELMGWDYEMVGEPDPQLWATVEWLGGYRRPLNATAGLVEPLLALAATPVTIADLVSFHTPELARPVVYHLMWHHRLLFDPTRPLRDHTQVWSARREGTS